MFFLHRIEPRYRGATANRFLKPIRQEGITNPHQVVTHVMVKVHQRAKCGDSVAKNLLDCLAGYPDEALHCAEYYVQREQYLNAEAYCHRIAHNPPTPSQLAYLRVLGYYDPPANELDANRITIQLMIKVAAAPKSLRTLQRKNGEFLVEQPEQKRSLSKLYENLERLLRKRLIKIALRLIWYIFLYHIGI